MTASPDTRRVANRILAYEAILLMSRFAQANGGDLIALLVFTGVWTSNTAHLRDERTRYSGLHDIPPDSQRRPIGDAALCDPLCIPRDIQDRYVQALIQYNNSADLWSTNLRLGLLGQANTGLFLVYNDTRGLHETIPAGGGRSLILKFSPMFDLGD